MIVFITGASSGIGAAVARAFAQTEALGVFRVSELRPGTYYVRAYVPTTVRPSHAAATQVSATNPAISVANLPSRRPRGQLTGLIQTFAGISCDPNP